ncbi:LemA family protein [Desulfatitalea alkaliphila]|uniref:LemA family protein n=1 Tax=Desulfatitalea alkaliphila TaxID=2929485 RepID=A0AA41UJE9_9BACT|nr:LemA family protein [Desulfatitalea alkaliphila]MCJ8501074.1 LemA family protein [Desulfatitalea alkaliphila]
MIAPFLIFGAFFLIIAIVWPIKTYNEFIKYKNGIEEAWSGIDVALKRRFNLIPNLIRVIEGYSEHEAQIMRSKGDYLARSADNLGRADQESRISESLSGLLALAEAYPDLKASGNFIALHQSLDEIEEDIQKARNHYNRFVGRFNTLVESFPASVIAAKFGFGKQNYFSLDLATQREMPTVGFAASRNGGGGAAPRPEPERGPGFGGGPDP